MGAVLSLIGSTIAFFWHVTVAVLTNPILLMVVGILMAGFMYWISKPLIVAWKSKATPDHPSENSFPTGVAEPRRKPFASLYDEATVFLSLVVPAYNEEERINDMMDEALEHLDKASRADSHFTYEIIVVDDGSKDDTVGKVMEYVSRRGSDTVRLLKLNKNHGKGGAVRKGFLRARGQYILMVDADGATRFAEIDNLMERLRAIEDKGLGIAVGSRAHLQGDATAERKWYRTILMHGFHIFSNLMCGGHNIRDTQCGFKLFTRRAAVATFPDLHIERWAFDVELLFLATRQNVPLVEVGVDWTEIDGSKVDIVSATLDMARDLMLIRFCYTVGVWAYAAPETVFLRDKTV